MTAPTIIFPIKHPFLACVPNNKYNKHCLLYSALQKQSFCLTTIRKNNFSIVNKSPDSTIYPDPGKHRSIFYKLCVLPNKGHCFAMETLFLRILLTANPRQGCSGTKGRQRRSEVLGEEWGPLCSICPAHRPGVLGQDRKL